MQVDANNRKVVFLGKAVRERPAVADSDKAEKLRKRGMISDKQLRRMRGKKDD